VWENAPVTITATGLPTGGTYSGGGFTDFTTFGQFSAINPTTGVLTYSSPIFGGTATVNITYTPSDPNFLSITLPFSVFVTSLVVTPASPLAILANSGTTTLTAFGLPNPGTYSRGALSDPEGTGVSISAINPTTGVMTVDGSTATLGGTATFTITYTPALPSVPLTITYTIIVTSLTFSPVSPAGVSVISGPLTVTATGLTAGGVYSGGNVADPITGGVFSLINPTTGVFTFSGAFRAGSATTTFTYDPPVGLTITLSYTVVVSSLEFSPPSPLAILAGDSATITAIGEPNSPVGLYSRTVVSLGGTGLVVSAINPTTGVFTVSGATTGGTATINVTFTPALSGSVPITLPYVVNVTSMTIASTTGNPGTMLVGDAPVTITATGLPTGGTYSGGGFTDLTTLGQFSAINPTTGVLTYSSPLFGGTATVNITYTPSDPNFLSITLPFSVFVTSLVVTPASPLAILANSGTTTLTAFGLPNPGTYSRGALSDPQGTGVSISAINPTTGVMTVDGSTATLGGTATFTITYTPALPSVPLTITYTIIVTSLTFSPVSPAGVSVISGPLTVTATGLTAGGVYSGGNVADPITGGVFSLIDPTTGVFTFSGAFHAGSATTTFTYDPPVGLTITLSYTVVVSSLEFNPPSPLAILAGDSVTITAIGEPNSPVGLYSRTVVSLGGTGLIVSAINPTTGVFTVSGATTGGTATINVTFTPALSGSVPITLPYVVNVTSMTIASTTGNPGTMLVGDAPVTITATGLPTGGTYSGGGFTDLTTLGQFSAINPTTGVLTYSSPLFGGTATVNITYTPSDPNFLSITLPFSVFVTSLVVAPASPLAILVGSGTTTLTAFGLPNPGTYSVSALSDPQGTGVTISAINPTTGVMTVIGSTATSGGTATFTITYTPALPSLPITITYTIVVTSLTFSPTSPAGFAVGSAPLTITATGLPAGGVYSNGGGSFDPLTKGTFSAIDSLSGVFTFSGAIEPGTASISVTYTPDPVTSGIPITLVYQVTVTRLTFTPSNPIALAVGDPDVLVRAVGEPAGGLYSLGAFTDGGTGVTLSAINALTGEFTVFNTSTTGGVASVPVTYDPDAGGPLASATVTFVINVTSLTFAPAPILELDVGVSSGTITATGLPTGGTYSGGGFVNPDTGGLFSTIHPTAGTFTFTGSTTGGIATVAITYTPAPASGFKAITVVYTVEVSALTFIPPSPLAVVAVPVVGSAPVTVTAVGDPSGGSYAVTAIVQADASHMFSAIDSVTGEFTFFGATVAGQSTITVEYTPPGGIGPVSTGTYTVNVSSMTFAPASPLEVLVGGAPATVTVTGTAGPAGGFVTFAAPSVGGTGGIFITPVVPVVSPATFTFDPSGATAAGVETIEVTFTPSNAGWAPVTLVYTVNVRTILFLPATPLTFPFASPIFPSTEIPDATITAIGLPGGGTFSFGTITTPTGGAFNLVSAGPGTGTFLFGDGDEGGAFPFTPLTSTGTSTVEIVYTPLVGSPVIVLYTVNVVAAVTFNVPNPYEIVAGSPTFTAVALGQPPGGTYAFGTLTSSFPGTGGSFTAIDPVTGIFFFGGSTSAGFETIEVLYTPVGALVPVSASFTVLVSNIVFSPTSTAIYDLISITPLTVTATGGQPGGLFFITAVDTTDTGGTFTLTSSGPTVGTFTFASPTSTGLASVQITYLPPVGSGPPVSITYFVRVINPKVICATPIVRIPTVGNSGFVVPAPTITVIDAPDEISDLNVFFFINHGRTGQVELTLTSPAGISVVITIDGVSISPPGGFPFPDGYAGVTFDDEAPLPLSALGGPGGGLFQPIGLLSAFDGTDGNGTWILTVEDNSSAPGANPAVGTGTLVAWCLIFDNETFVAPPVAATSFSFADSLGVAPPIGIAFPLGGVNSTLAAGDMFSFTVAGGPSRLIDLDVLFDMTHGRPSQVGLLDVTGPTAATSRLIPDGGLMLGAVFSTSLSPIFFDDTGGPPITNYSTLGPVFPPAPGTTFAPSTPLSVFTGTDPNGLWTLAIRDNSSGAGALGTGTFDEWVLEMVGFTDVYLSGTPPGTTVTDTNVLIDTIEVPIGAPLIATDFRLAVSILHPDLSELDVFVRFRPDDVPVPVLVPLFTPGTVTGIDMGVIFDDTAASIATFTGSPGNPGPFASFSPTGTLATFVGIDPAGEWDLIITDTTAGNDGTLVFWGFAIDGEFFPSPIE
jgi:subtilisin-like proprotein convertase family protein/phosphoheptose isomerase